MGHLRLIIQAKAIMGAAYLVALLAIASTCNGASIQKREAIVGRLDRSLDLFGIRLGIQYKDPSDRTKGGKLDFAIDDMKAYFPKAHSSAIELKISRTGNGNEREIEINGKKLGSGDYTLTDNSFSTKITNAAGDWLEPKITWEGALPKNKDEAANFFAQNNVKVHATGSKRNFDIDLSWKATKPDWDWSTPESMMNLNIKGKGP